MRRLVRNGQKWLLGSELHVLRRRRGPPASGRRIRVSACLERWNRDALRGGNRVRQQMRRSHMKRSSRSLVRVSALVAIAAAVAVTAAMASNGSTAAKPTNVVRHRVSPRLEHLIGALTRAHRASANAHPLPAAVEEGESPQSTLVTFAAVFTGGAYPTWIVPGSTEVCLDNSALKPGGGAGGICGTIAAFEQRGLAGTTESASGSPVVLGLVPDGNTSVGVTNANGTKDTVPVANNVYEITSGDPVSATLKNAAGTTITRHLAVLSTPPPSAPPGSPVQ
jgi:hypothetical protein